MTDPDEPTWVLLDFPLWIIRRDEDDTEEGET